MPEVLVTPAVENPVSLEDAKLFLRVTHNKEDTEIESAIDDATRYLEDRLGQQFLTAEWILALPCFPSCEIRLPRPPLQTIEKVNYIDSNGTAQVLATSEYQIDIYSKPARIMPAYGKFWPDSRYETFNAVTIEYTAGYGDTAESVPPAIKRAIKYVVGHWYYTREPIADRPTSKIDLTLDSLLASVWHGDYVGLK